METAIETIQRTSTIGFPGLFGDWTIDPPASFTLFGRSIYFYGVFIALGFLLGITYCAKNSKRFGIREDDVYDLILWLIPLSIIGARLYFIAFKAEYYLAHPGEIVEIWNGGLAIYGGVIAGVIVMLLVCRHKKIPWQAMFDLLIFGLLIGQILGVHPTFLYESLWNLVGFIALTIWERRGGRRYDGQAALGYFFWYGLGRAWIEGLRTDSLYIGGSSLRVSQLLSIVLCLTALVLLIVNARKKHPPEELYVNRVAAAEAAVIVNNQENTEEEQA